jgi:fructose-1-phosphate kinase PfkB-like protein
VGGATGDEIRADLEATGVVARFVDDVGSSRRTVNVVSAVHGDATIFNEPSPELTGPGWQSLVAGLDSVMAEVAALAAGLASGSPWRQMVQDAVTWSAAAVLQPIAGQIGPDDVARLASQVLMEAR